MSLFESESVFVILSNWIWDSLFWIIFCSLSAIPQCCWLFL